MARKYTRYTAELGEAFCDRIATSTDSNKKICQDPGMPDEKTIYLWLRKNPEFRAMYDSAKSAQVHIFADEMIAISEEQPTMTVNGKFGDYTCVDPAGVNRNKVRIDTIKWVASHLAPAKYGDKIKAEVTGEAGGPLVFRVERMGK